MNLQTKMPTTADEFLRWNEGREGKREFVKGRVVELMINVTRNHADIATNLILLMRGQLDRREFSVGSADFAVRTPDGIRFPDVYVDRKSPEARGTDLAAVEPVILVEVLSPSSLARDFHDKWNDYRGISSLVHYLVISHEEARVWLTTRSGETWSAIESFAGLEEIVFFPGFGISLPLADIYDGVELRPGA
jgi:Uma2 family endonuclease